MILKTEELDDHIVKNYPHVVQVTAIKRDSEIKWCREHLGTDGLAGWPTNHSPSKCVWTFLGDHFYFRNASDAILFKLTKSQWEEAR